jgi:hypothetical protein
MSHTETPIVTWRSYTFINLLFINRLTSCSRATQQSCQETSRISVTRMFISVFTKARHRSLDLATWIQYTLSHCSYIRHVYILILSLPLHLSPRCLVVSELTKIRGFKPGRGQRIYKGDKNPQHGILRRGIPRRGSRRPHVVTILRHVKGSSEYETDTTQAKSGSHFSPSFSRFATRFLCW